LRFPAEFKTSGVEVPLETRIRFGFVEAVVIGEGRIVTTLVTVIEKAEMKISFKYFVAASSQNHFLRPSIKILN